MRLPWRAWYGLVIYGFLIYILLLIILFPAKLAWQLVPDTLRKTISITGLEGSAWSAQADHIVINGVDLGKVEWTLNPITLITGKVGGYVKINNVLGHVSGGFSINSDQLVELNDLTGEINASLFDSVARPFLLTGLMKPEIITARLQQKTLLEVTGNIEWQSAMISGVQDVSLGQVLVKAIPDKTGTRLQLTNQGGMIDINGVIQVSGNGQYQTDLYVLNRDKNRKELETGLAMMLGRPDATGRRRFNTRGRIPGW